MPANRYFIFAAIALIGCGIDLLTKHLVFQWLGEPDPKPLEPPVTYWLVPEYFGFQTAVNTGAVFGLGQGLSAIFAAISVVAVAGIVIWLFCAKAARDMFLTIALGLVVGGILGNLYDRLGLWNSQFEQNRYAVRDWILMQIPGYRPWPNYNIADCLLVCGAALLAWHVMFSRTEASSADDEGTQAA